MSTDNRPDSSSETGDYSFMQEKVLPKKKRSRKKTIKSLANTVVLAVIFGLISSCVFHLSNPYFDELFGTDREPFVFPETSPSPAISEEPSTEPSTEPSIEPSKPSGLATESEDNEDTDAVITEREHLELVTIKEYRKLYTLLAEVHENSKNSVVTVSSVTDEVDWLNNPFEKTDASYGVVIANNESELLIMASKDKIENANQIRVTFRNNTTVEAELYAYDSDTGIAMISIPLENIPEVTLDTVVVAALGDSYQLSVGTPVLALGCPNGYMYSMMIGFITNKCTEKYITDYKLDVYNTDMDENSYGEGIVVNVEGVIMGVITHDYKDEYNADSMTILGISKLKPIIEDMINKRPRTYAGIVVNDITGEYAKAIKVESGVYVAEVLADSPALEGGLKNGDVITEIDDVPIASAIAYSNILRNHEPGDKIKVKVKRTSKKEKPEVTFTIELGKKSNKK
ncbi:S1C family serine protease [Anaeromicropila populeti]|uniref:Trypsin-like peptidase domain-containing protein n=1 Tax=Anaeromicropila populeti TaxID=37658 RepID=A0A1I6IZ13_9FIRM|nr:S1C family serine protease [Anaeromicropila populeti]SFR71919.1 Trypsin-like peptidase domain-containing protein [Anaeromicropila populeti]